MAILSGFPPSNTISAGVRIAEKDLSFVAPEQSFHRAGIVGFASKGPINTATRIATTRALNSTFGFPHPDVSDPYLIYAGQQYLQVANELWVVRVAEQSTVNDEAAETASFDIPSAGGKVIITSDTAGPYSFVTANDDNFFFRWRLNGVLSSKTLLVWGDNNRAGSDAGDPYSCEDLVTELNEQLDTSADGIEFFCTDDDKIGVSTTYAFGPDSTLELVSVSHAIYGGAVLDGNPTGLGTGMTIGQSTGSIDRWPNDSYQVAGNWDFNGLTQSALNLHVVVDGTDNSLIDGVVQVIDLSSLVGDTYTTTDVVAEINAILAAGDIPGGFEAADVGDNLSLKTLHHGRDAKLLIKSDSPGFDIFGFSGLTAVGTSPSGASGSASVETFGLVSGTTNDSSEVTFTLKAESPGIEGNNTQVVVKNDIRSGTWIMEVYNNGVQVEAWGNLTKDEQSSLYVETYLAGVSDFIRVTDNTDVSSPPAAGTYTLAGGSDGIPSDPDDQDDLLIGNNLGSTGMYALSDPEQFDVDLIAIPGHSSTSVVMALLDMCQNMRQNSLAIIDPPFGLTVNETVAWQNGTHPLNLTRFDSDFGALYWPWLKYRDNYNRVDVWIPPSGAVLAVIARSDALSAPWFAPAGVNRGVVPGITDVYTRPTKDEMDLMYGYHNAVNPIISFPDIDGFVVWGQKTLQRRPTALDRVNVRRLLFVIEKRIRQASRLMLFDPHDDVFHLKFIDLATAILREVQTGRGINDFRIQADAELNTPDVIDRNEFRARIGIQPTRAVEFMFIEFSVHRTGSFTENSDTF